ncbi:ShlB/FhaC/HecB family hemolysin secretion/activation protein [Pseudomonas sp. RIT-PI-S]|uniref:ShlB/FhaC/HecB family hemolysin secretion/activation protein n=1 Tax=Pseudomonas sp. RIT-PI-S TaxID=3035295 RepID=UPI0021DA94E1|nr:ShlB/FhaC/HecB family hemolysin secretion/activation protein [Pseudomonas sp. RIT-PI-S]
MFGVKNIHLIVAVACTLHAASASGNASLQTPAQEPSLFLHEAQQRREAIEQDQRQRQLRREPAPARVPAIRTADGAEAPEAPCWYLSGVSLSGNQLIDDAAIRTAIAPLLAPCLGPGRINQILATITSLYTAAGYVASRPLLLAPPADGQALELAIEEGFVEAVELADQDLPISLGAAFPDMLGEPLQLRALEQGLDQLNRLRSIDLTADIEPGQWRGGSRIVLRSLSRLPRWQASGGLDNGGSASTGRHRSHFSLALDSPLEHNDFFSLYGVHSRVGDAAGSETVGGYYSLPWGPWSVSLGANHFRHRSVAEGLRGSLALSGSTTLLSYSVERALWRDQNSLLSATLRLDDKRAEGRLSGQRLPVQSPRYHSLEAGLNALWLGEATWVVYLGYSRGLGGWSGNDGLKVKQPGAQSARYGKWRANVSRTASLSWAGLNWTLASIWQGQYSAQRMPQLESLPLASGSIVRGFERRAAQGDSGLAWRNTLSLPLALPQGLRLNPSLGLDAGWLEGQGQARGDHLLGASFGMSLDHPSGSLAAEYQRSLYRRNAPREPGFWRLALQLRF